MKWVVITILLLVIGGWWYKANQPPQKQKKESTDQSAKSVSYVSSSIFIPYWNIPSETDDLSDYDTLIYFGVAPDSSGEMIHDAGFNNIELFVVNQVEMKRASSLLTVRMLHDEVSLGILEDVSLQSSVISQSIELANEYGFDGIVLDLELGVIPFEDSKEKITAFVELFSEAIYNPDNTNTMTFSMTMYGDVFYRARPYDVAALAKHVDHMYIMAYDFHKSRGEPGPNFPFDSGSTNSPSLRASPSESFSANRYPYNFQTMIIDFTDIMSPEDITVVFGMYGYDWTLGPQGLPLKAAVAVPLDGIDGIDAIVDPNSLEKHILFTDDEGFDHELWYEDEESADVKIEYLKEQGVGSVGYWVWGYFN